VVWYKLLQEGHDEWVELGGETPSTDFPRGTHNTSLERNTSLHSHESVIFWWFAPTQEEGSNTEDFTDDSFFLEDTPGI
jgi:hypothetical protein